MSAGSYLISVILGVSILLISNIARADKIPRSPYIGPQYFFTTKMDPIDVALWPDLRIKADRPPVARFSLPRAYIFYVSRAADKSTKPLPQSVQARSVNIMLIYPEGIPYSHAIRDYNKKHRVSSWVAAGKLRPRLLIAKIRGVLGDAYNLSYLFPESKNTKVKRETYVGTYSGLKHYTTGGIIETFYGPETALIRKIRCGRSLAKTHPRFFCTYYVVLSNHLISEVDFVDFRVHGGVQFAEERVRAFKATICQYVRCDREPSRRDNVKRRN